MACNIVDMFYCSGFASVQSSFFMNQQICLSRILVIYFSRMKESGLEKLPQNKTAVSQEMIFAVSTGHKTQNDILRNGVFGCLCPYLLYSK